MRRLRCSSPATPQVGTRGSCSIRWSRGCAYRGCSACCGQRKAMKGVPMRWRLRRSDDACDVSELAWRLERLCETGVALRAEGWCVGVPLAAEVAVHAAGLVRVRRVPGDAIRFARHLRRGHDRSCAALGVPVETLRRLISTWDGIGGGALVLEAATEAVMEITASLHGRDWSAHGALETLAHAIRRRLTPVAPHEQEQARRSVRSDGPDLDKKARAIRSRDRLRSAPTQGAV